MFVKKDLVYVRKKIIFHQVTTLYTSVLQWENWMKYTTCSCIQYFSNYRQFFLIWLHLTSINFSDLKFSQGKTIFSWRTRKSSGTTIMNESKKSTFVMAYRLWNMECIEQMRLCWKITNISKKWLFIFSFISWTFQMTIVFIFSHSSKSYPLPTFI